MSAFRHMSSTSRPRFGPEARILAVVLLTVAALASVLLTACGGNGPAATSTPASADKLPVPARAVSFTTDDGVTLRGHVFGSGRESVILAHMYPADQTSWYATAERLAQQGYMALTFDFRGYGESGGQKQVALIDRDVDAAIAWIRGEGASEVVLVGASMGGTASLIAGVRAQTLSSIRLAGIATLSAPVEFQGLSASDAVPRLVVPLLFIAAEKDVGAAGARELEQLSSGRGGLEIVPGSDHGTDLLTGKQREKVSALLFQFVKDSFTP
jgi:pimeloyl-ACP methyl ester carboxylesterase